MRVLARIVKAIKSLSDVMAQRRVAANIHSRYGGPLTSGAKRTAKWRHARDVTPVTPEHVTRVTPPPTPPLCAVPEVAGSKTGNSNGKYRKEAQEVLDFLNVKAEKSFPPTQANLRLIEARLRENASVQDCKSVIARQIREWKTNPEMKKYLRPATLFNATKFSQYVGEAAPVREGES